MAGFGGAGGQLFLFPRGTLRPLLPPLKCTPLTQSEPAEPTTLVQLDGAGNLVDLLTCPQLSGRIPRTIERRDLPGATYDPADDPKKVRTRTQSECSPIVLCFMLFRVTLGKGPAPLVYLSHASRYPTSVSNPQAKDSVRIRDKLLEHFPNAVVVRRDVVCVCCMCVRVSVHVTRVLVCRVQAAGALPQRSRGARRAVVRVCAFVCMRARA